MPYKFPWTLCSSNFGDLWEMNYEGSWACEPWRLYICHTAESSLQQKYPPCYLSPSKHLSFELPTPKESVCKYVKYVWSKHW